MKQDFLNYIQETFEFSPDEMQDFQAALSKPLKKTLRVNTNKISIEDFKTLATKQGWTLGETPLGKNMFYVDRENITFALGHSLEHIAGYFYVQELAASSSPFYMSGDSVDTGEYTILDMSASPGGKTTQLAEYYPNSTIIANEIDKGRMKQLHENLDRLGAANTYVTNYDGRFFGNFPEVFDKILLDAPCSGEGTAYKSGDALKYWNLKNIRRIAKLQFQLLENALQAVKVGGELVYSTCTLNRLENEEILNKLTDVYGDHFSIALLDRENNHPLVRAWPHKNNTGGFFVAKIVKTSSLPEKKKKEFKNNPQGFEKLSNTAEKTVTEFLIQNFDLTLPGKFYTYRNEIYYGEKNIDYFWENFFLFKAGIKIGKLESGVFEPNYFLGTNFRIFTKNNISIDEKNINSLLKGEEIDYKGIDGYYQIQHNSIPSGVVKLKNNTMKSLLENRFLRK
ncbi:NOL1/NOP2/sun family putative RNA methylase [Candidatus Gracilibacteria bacterium]|nr:NOL1/NOP2/sun family putative RNA methylase [Candidatus Gracilibacteria bacterium]